MAGLDRRQLVAHPRRGYAERMALALRLLADPVFDSLITGASPFEEMPELLSGELPALCHRIDYGADHVHR